MTLHARKNLAEYLVAATAFFVSICTLGVYLYQSRLMTQQQHVSVWPYVEWYSGDIADYHLAAQNKGVGPAIIRKVDIRLDDKPVADLRALLTAVMGQNPGFSLETSTLLGRVLAPREEVMAFVIHDHKDATRFEQQFDHHKFTMQITYCSIYGDCWISDGAAVQRTDHADLGLD
jgi:hypothetical protein